MNQQANTSIPPISEATQTQKRGPDEVLMVFGTAPEKEAKRLAETLIRERLVACVNLVPGVLSVYRWQGKIHDDSETLLLMKTARRGFRRLERRYVELHSYQLPELLALSIDDGHAAYLRWVSSMAASD